MCRLLGWATRTPVTLQGLLGEEDLLDFTELSVKHGDGWGVARATETGVKVHKRPDTARDSRLFALWARTHATDLGMAHLRWATMGLGVGIENTHPFTDGRVAFAHKGRCYRRRRSTAGRPAGRPAAARNHRQRALLPGPAPHAWRTARRRMRRCATSPTRSPARRPSPA